MTRINQKWLNWRMLIIESRDLSFGAKAIGLYLNTFMNDRHDFAFPSIATIMGEMNIGSNTTAVKYINELERTGWLTKSKRFGKSTLYYAAVPESVISITESTLVQNLNDSITESKPTVLHNLNTNKQSNKQSNKQRGGAKARFVKPTESEVTAYAKEKGWNIDAVKFCSFYESKGWMVGKNKMKSWRAAITNSRSWSEVKSAAVGDATNGWNGYCSPGAI